MQKKDGEGIVGKDSQLGLYICMRELGGGTCTHAVQFGSLDCGTGEPKDLRFQGS